MTAQFVAPLLPRQGQKPGWAVRIDGVRYWIVRMIDQFRAVLRRATIQPGDDARAINAQARKAVTLPPATVALAPRPTITVQPASWRHPLRTVCTLIVLIAIGTDR